MNAVSQHLGPLAWTSFGGYTEVSGLINTYSGQHLAAYSSRKPY